MKLPGKYVWAGVLSAMVGLSAPAWADGKPTLKIGYVEGWDDSVATSNVAARIIEKRFGYQVQLVPVAAGIMWQGVARGDLDATLSAWLPVTQGAYWAQFKDKVVDLGTNFPGAKIGLVVPDYVGAKSIDDLNAQKSAFGGRIVGIDAGAGVMTKTDQAVKQYDLSYTVMPSSGSAMTAELARSLNAKKPVIVTGWTPHWMFAKYKLRFLDDPKNVYGAAEHVDNVANPELETKAPQVVSFLKKFQWKPGEIDSVMLAIQNGEKPDAAADTWIAAHGDRVNTWVAAQ
ncbi:MULTISPECIES: glycine betaine ABC transporter substrate-binding protein [Paraburkholderia]|uniref:Glycine betaine/proline transport system substrate-binding protein n=1 Tax=Paraburkholderia tropica TaxID=92647 RepID=A0A1A5XE28_9BURK|nr:MULTISPECIES: glycine betaine ABC transporter substrate-binding protein [Paraburkholderia]MBB2978861.1 glycine betaine/proline transport system substrate-binding protein [Paraburkholderia tropica]MBB2999308.1 glycine betaine/proline transport system substrate-binding protein [Paraburkholderia tropica]MDE1139032.1 glycine betaine ABC transporter substrate-binding protein [Paraburkholderia tropica]OBR51741.1 glycine/betaine ABC transporter substrate-binding protein [Paraburkholderia tropica]P